MRSDLFCTLADEAARHHRESRDQGSVAFGVETAPRLWAALLTGIRRGGRSVEVVGGSRRPDPVGGRFEAERAAARRGCFVERVVLLADPSPDVEQALSRTLDLDRRAGVLTRVVDVRDVLASGHLPPTPSLEHGLWDDEVCCTPISPSAAVGEPHGWRVSARQDDLDAARAVGRAVDAAPDVDGEDRVHPSPLEPLLRSAPVVRSVAPVLCARYADGDTCAWYHGLWQYLRIFGVAAAPDRNRPFFEEVLGSIAERASGARVLVSGAADYSMLALVLHAFRAAGGSPAVTVLDRCETPTFVSKWYARWLGTDVRAEVADILSFSAPGRFDAICTHSFLPMLPAVDRPGLVARWRAALAPRGQVVTVVRLAPSGSEEPARFTPDQADGFARRVKEEATRWRAVLDVDPEEMSEAARSWAARSVSHPVSSIDQVRELFEGGGFRLERVDVSEVPGKVSAGGWGPGTSQAARYAQILASAS